MSICLRPAQDLVGDHGKMRFLFGPFQEFMIVENIDFGRKIGAGDLNRDVAQRNVFGLSKSDDLVPLTIDMHRCHSSRKPVKFVSNDVHWKGEQNMVSGTDQEPPTWYARQ